MAGSEVVLYHGMASTCSKKVRLCLYEKQIAFESHLLDLQKFEQHQPAYLALNPNGVVPTLVHRGAPVIESSVIIEYLDDAFPDIPLKPADPLARAQMRLWLKYSDDVAYKAVFAPTWQFLKDRAKAGLTDEARKATLAAIPTAERRERWEKMAQGGFSAGELEAAYDKMRQCLDDLEAAVARGPWLAGETYSLADIAIVPFIDRIRNLRPEFMPEAERPLANDWYGRMKARPAFDKAFRFRDDPRAAELPNL